MFIFIQYMPLFILCLQNWFIYSFYIFVRTRNPNQLYAKLINPKTDLHEVYLSRLSDKFTRMKKPISLNRSARDPIKLPNKHPYGHVAQS